MIPVPAPAREGTPEIVSIELADACQPRRHINNETVRKRDDDGHADVAERREAPTEPGERAIEQQSSGCGSHARRPHQQRGNGRQRRTEEQSRVWACILLTSNLSHPVIDEKIQVRR
jgi:hypothetical protein